MVKKKLISGIVMRFMKNIKNKLMRGALGSNPFSGMHIVGTLQKSIVSRYLMDFRRNDQ